MMNTALFAAALIVSANAVAAPFSFDAARNQCVDAQGNPGWNHGVRGECGDFRGASLENANLNDLDLRGARFDGASLQHANFMRSNLQGATFEDADLTGAVLNGAHLEHAQLRHTRLVGANLQFVTLSGAVVDESDLRNACLYRTSFEGTDLRTAMFSQQKNLLDGARFNAAIVSSDTLPYSASELSARGVKVLGVNPLFVER